MRELELWSIKHLQDADNGKLSHGVSASMRCCSIWRRSHLFALLIRRQRKFPALRTLFATRVEKTTDEGTEQKETLKKLCGEIADKPQAEINLQHRTLCCSTSFPLNVCEEGFDADDGSFVVRYC